MEITDCYYINPLMQSWILLFALVKVCFIWTVSCMLSFILHGYMVVSAAQVLERNTGPAFFKSLLSGLPCRYTSTCVTQGVVTGGWWGHIPTTFSRVTRIICVNWLVKMDGFYSAAYNLINKTRSRCSVGETVWHVQWWWKTILLLLWITLFFPKCNGFWK